MIVIDEADGDVSLVYSWAKDRINKRLIMTTTKLIEIKIGDNGCTLRAIEGGADLALSHGQVARAVADGNHDEVPLYTYQQYKMGIDTWIAFLNLINDEIGPNPDAIDIVRR